MKKVLKIAGITLGVLLILILVLPFAFQGKIEKLVKQEGNKMLNAQFDFSALDISLIRNFPSASITLEDFWLKGAGEFQNDTLIQAGELTAAVNLFSLFGNSGYDISKIIIEDSESHRPGERTPQLGRNEAFCRHNRYGRNPNRKRTDTHQAAKTFDKRPFRKLR